MDERRQELRLTWTEVARRAGLTPEALRLIRTSETDLRQSTKDGIEDALRWERGSVDLILADGDPIPLANFEPASDGPSQRGGVVPAPGPTFESALEAYGQALQQLRRVATTDPNVPAKALSIIEDWEMMYTAMVYGGVDAVMRAIADSYRRGLPGESSHGQTG